MKIKLTVIIPTLTFLSSAVAMGNFPTEILNIKNFLSPQNQAINIIFINKDISSVYISRTEVDKNYFDVWDLDTGNYNSNEINHKINYLIQNEKAGGLIAGLGDIENNGDYRSSVAFIGTDGQIIKYIGDRKKGVEILALLPDGESLIVSYTDDFSVLWDIPSNTPILAGESDTVNKIDIHPSGKSILIVEPSTEDNSGSATVWTYPGNEIIYRLDNESIDSAQWMPDGRHILAYADKKIYIYDIFDIENPEILYGPYDLSTITGDGRFVFAVDHNYQDMVIFDRETEKFYFEDQIPDGLPSRLVPIPGSDEVIAWYPETGTLTHIRIGPPQTTGIHDDYLHDPIDN